MTPYKAPEKSTPWSQETALKAAQKWGLQLGQDAWDIIEATRRYALSQGRIPTLAQVVDEVGRSFHWGRKRSLAKLYQLFRTEPHARLVVLAGQRGWC